MNKLCINQITRYKKILEAVLTTIEFDKYLWVIVKKNVEKLIILIGFRYILIQKGVRCGTIYIYTYIKKNIYTRTYPH